MTWRSNQQLKDWSLTTLIIAATALILKLMGRVATCTCGYVSLWHANIWSSGNSQHIFDWYTFSHLIHGFIFYAVLNRFAPKWSIGKRMVVAMLIESAWEILENSPLIINRYRDTTASLVYTGDSILNSVFDILAALVGFWLARKLPVNVSLVLILLMEIIVGYIIHDNLALNIVMLIYPLQAVKAWQLELAP